MPNVGVDLLFVAVGVLAIDWARTKDVLQWRAPEVKRWLGRVTLALTRMAVAAHVDAARTHRSYHEPSKETVPDSVSHWIDGFGTASMADRTFEDVQSLARATRMLANELSQPLVEDHELDETIDAFNTTAKAFVKDSRAFHDPYFYQLRDDSIVALAQATHALIAAITRLTTKYKVSWGRTLMFKDPDADYVTDMEDFDLSLTLAQLH